MVLRAPHNTMPLSFYQLAVARADEGKLKARLGQETARHAELGRSLEHAYTKIIEAGLDPGVSEAP